MCIRDRGEAATTVHTVGHDKAVDAFTTSIKWAGENGVSACGILVLKKLQEKALKCGFKPRNGHKCSPFSF